MLNLKKKQMALITKNAPTIWSCLNGIICVYKPSGVTNTKIRADLINKLCKELNQQDCRPPLPYVSITGDITSELTVNVRESYFDSPLVVGPRYQPQDVRCTWATPLAKNISGVVVLGINDGAKLVNNLSISQPVRAYRIKGRLGETRDNHFSDGAVVEKSTWKHVKRHHLDGLLSSIQASHQSKMFELSGVDIQSQAAYELAAKGLIRPRDTKIPLIYGLKCVEFEPPDFTLEIQSINEYEAYFLVLINEIGRKVRSTAHCTAMKCIRNGYYTLEHALLQKHWTLQYVVDNMKMCTEIYESKGKAVLNRPILE